MLHLALYEPEIPPNTGNIMRLCANTGCALHLVGPLGFSIDDRQLRRAGLDYRDYASVSRHDSFEDLASAVRPARCWALTTRGGRRYTDARFGDNDLLLFGPETRGLPAPLLASLGKEHCLRIPMLATSRSLNLSNAAALVTYEALRQLGFPGMD